VSLSGSGLTSDIAKSSRFAALRRAYADAHAAPVTTDASINTDRIAEREGCSVRKVNMTISLAFLAPDLVKAAIDGRLPYGMGIARLTDLPAEWSKRAVWRSPPLRFAPVKSAATRFAPRY
jgi:hypothetical protein